MDVPEEEVVEPESEPEESEPSLGEPNGPNLQVLLTDAPGDFDEVWVEIDRVEIETADGWLALAEEPQTLDLLTLQNGVTTALGDAELEPGYYGQLRLIVASAFIVKDGVSEDLTIASGTETGIKLNLEADIEDGMAYQVVVDFDAHKSIKYAGNKWLMTPVVKVEDLVGTPIEPAEGESTEGQGTEGESTEGESTEGGTTDGGTTEGEEGAIE